MVLQRAVPLLGRPLTSPCRAFASLLRESDSSLRLFRSNGGHGATPGAAQQSEQVLQHWGLSGGAHPGPGEPRTGVMRVRGSSVSFPGDLSELAGHAEAEAQSSRGVRSDYGHETLDAPLLTAGRSQARPQQVVQAALAHLKAAQGSALLPQGECM